MKALYCWKCDENGVEMTKDYNSLTWTCPREGCDEHWTMDEVVEKSCDRCHEGPDEDLRTLWMACFYAMEELGLPFSEVAIRGIPEIEGAAPDKDPTLYRFYTLRVCKNCRADWMQAIKVWFRSPPTDDEIHVWDAPVRVLGAVRPHVEPA